MVARLYGTVPDSWAHGWRTPLGGHWHALRAEERGFHIGLVSNIDESDFRDFLAVEDFGGYFDAHISSEAARSCKARPGDLRHCAETGRLPAGGSGFHGDVPAQDVDGAAAAGMQTVLIHDEFELSAGKQNRRINRIRDQ